MKKSTGEDSKESSGDGVPKLQISVPCRGGTRPAFHYPAILGNGGLVLKNYP